MRLTCNQFDQFVGRLFFETLVSGLVIKQSWLKKIIQTAIHIVLEIAAFWSTTMVSTVIYYIVRPSIYFSPSKFFLIVLAQKFQCLICSSSSNSFQVFSYSLMMDVCIHDGLISNTQQYIDLLDSRWDDHISWIWVSGKNNKNFFHSFSSLLTQKANWNT